MSDFRRAAKASAPKPLRAMAATLLDERSARWTPPFFGRDEANALVNTDGRLPGPIDRDDSNFRQVKDDSALVHRQITGSLPLLIGSDFALIATDVHTAPST